MTTTPVLTERDGAIGRITLNRPESMNAITVEMGSHLEQAIRALGNDPAIHVVLIRGAGGNFCVGGDFREVERLRGEGRHSLQALFDNFSHACAAISEVEAPVVVAVEGNAMAGGFELMLAADIALVHEAARLADNHANFGQIPGGGSSQRLPRLVGRQRALGLILSGERLTGAQAAQWGLAYRSLPADSFDEAVESFVAALAAKSRAAAVTTKRVVYAGLEEPLKRGLQIESDAVVEFIAGDAGAAGVAQFKDRGA